ncbi:MAG: hypothetical protein PVH61_30550 [Candidatus Aminicenantes bacterium]
MYTIEDLNREVLEFEDIDIPDFSDFNVYKKGGKIPWIDSVILKLRN